MGEVWVEIAHRNGSFSNSEKSPPVGEVWVEIRTAMLTMTAIIRRLPWGRCGLKCQRTEMVITALSSPPVGEVWVEIGVHLETDRGQMSPPVGEVWVEMI